MKVKTFVVGLAEGINGAMELLDERVEELGDITIHNLTDTLYPDPIPDGRMVRVVVFSKKGA